jgi:xanthine dehydrogenase YagR molybdenum-binding subunit
MNISPDDLEAAEGRIRSKANPQKSIAWKDACKLLGQMSITQQGRHQGGARTELTGSGVGGVQIADVSVDVETGLVKMNEMVAVQDCGLIIDLKLAESQVYGALIMGITYALFEEAIYDRQTGRMLNADMEFYRLATLPDVGKLRVHMMTGKGYDERGVIGLGEPPVISPGAAISNAVANAIGVRVPSIPLTPNRVIEALENGGVPT